jgi:hypothetical protein
MTCKECEKYLRELENKSIAEFLHDNIQDTHLADTLLDLFDYVQNMNMYESVKEFMEIFKSRKDIWENKIDMTKVKCPQCYAMDNCTIKETCKKKMELIR